MSFLSNTCLSSNTIKFVSVNQAISGFYKGYLIYFRISNSKR